MCQASLAVEWFAVVTAGFMIQAPQVDAWSSEAPAEQYCDEFCSRVQRLCTGEDQCFSSEEKCKRKCEHWSRSGYIGEIVGNNTLHCRTFWLDAVEQFAHAEIVIQGLCDYACEGGGMCDPSVPFDCTSYCAQMTEPDRSDCGPGPWNFNSKKDCLSYCTQAKRGVRDTLDDTLECRILAINIGEQSLYSKSQMEFCPSAGASGGKFCKSDVMDQPCKLYCDWMDKFCGYRPSQQTYNQEDCLSICEGWPRTGSLGDTQGNTLQCRLKYMAVAARSTVPEIACNHDLLCKEPYELPNQGREQAGYWALEEAREDIISRFKILQEKQASRHHSNEQEELEEL